MAEGVSEGRAECGLSFYFPGNCLAEVQSLQLKSLGLSYLGLRAYHS